MGEMADYFNDQMMDIDELQQQYSDFDAAVENGVDELLYDYDGSRFPEVFSGIGQRPYVKPHGPGPCPCCGSATVLKTNRATQAEFYGCSTFPKCRGSRDA